MFVPTVKLDNVEIYYQDTGPSIAPAIVFSHSLFFDHRMFEHQVARFSASHRVIVYDHRGRGLSGLPRDKCFDMDAMTGDAIAVLERLARGPVHFVGQSMGGVVALRLAARRPELLRSVVVLGSTAEREHRRAEFEPWLVPIGTTGGRGLSDILMFMMFGDTTLADPARGSFRRFWRDHFETLPPTTAGLVRGTITRDCFLVELASTAVPILALAGAEDHVRPVEFSKRIAVAAPRGQWDVVAGAGHVLPLEQPDMVNERLQEFFSSVEQCGSR